MKRRTFIFSAALFPFASQAFAAGEWEARLVVGDEEGGSMRAGLHIKLADSWKTYWRVPGEAGVPPQFALAGDAQSRIAVEFPAPLRIADQSGEAIGYLGEVLFPILISAADLSVVEVSAFFGVCHDVCKPARFSASLAGADKNPGLIADWLARVPMQSDFAASARQDKESLVLDLSLSCSDIFVEGPDGLYFRKPAFEGQRAILKIDGLQPGDGLSGKELRLTALAGGKGLEQRVIVA
jgi:DsbC/DsbD-like thiol-disulfide interchange protein